MKSAVSNLERWYKKVARPLPWRQTSDPYKIWISEVMLQQTQVQVVIPYFERFLKAFPTVKALALAKEESVLKLWSGLGYYSRARNLKKGAEEIVRSHSGNFPKDRDTLLTVPGIGPYTAGAVLSIAFDLAVPLVDGNVMRVFSRFYNFKKEIEQKNSQAFFWEKASDWVSQAHSPRILNQALMELGATVCTKSSPRCHLCPLSKACVGLAKDTHLELPKRKKRAKSKELYWRPLIIEFEDSILLQQNKEGSWWKGLWDFPRLELKNQSELFHEHKSPLRHLGSGQPLSLHKHTVTHHRIHAVPFQYRVKKKPALSGRWVSKSEIDSLPLSAFARKIGTAYLLTTGCVEPK